MKVFDKLIEGVVIEGEKMTLERLIKESKSKWEYPEWGLPKGRRNLKERDLDCAIREFEEETDIARKDIHVIRSIEPLDEIFVGSNKRPYKHIYYIAKLINDDIEVKINNLKKLQMIEIGDIKWFTLTESLKKIRSYNREKKNIMREADQIIEDMESMDLIL